MSTKYEKEYEVLRKEMDDRMNSVNSYNIVMLTVTVTILGFALQQDHYAMCLIPIIIIVPTYLRNIDADKAVIKMGAYLNVFLEGEDFNWERRNHKRDKTLKKKSFALRMFSVYNSLIIICVLLAIYKCLSGNHDLIHLSIIIILSIGLFSIWVVEHHQINHYSIKKDYVNEWESIKKQEKREIKDTYQV